MSAYYNEIDPKAAAWLRELIKAGHIAPGDVDERSIEDITPNEIRKYTQCHFFAGIGVWSHALRNAGWPDDEPIWTGSCPCQPFSAAGKGAGVDDERHLWPAFHWLIKQCRPGVVLGEQVAHKAGAAWFDIVSTDLEGEDYTCGKVVFPACGVGAPHLRQRQYWVADSNLQHERPARQHTEGVTDPTRASEACKLADSNSERHDGERILPREKQREDLEVAGSGEACKLADTEHSGPQGRIRRGTDTKWEDLNGYPGCSSTIGMPQPTNGHWRDVDWLGCRDDKWRPVEPGTFPLANGSPARVGRLRGYGNAIVAPQAQAFIEVVQETLADHH
jgi:DNA (cytosine-5)-methyltransferase 1